MKSAGQSLHPAATRPRHLGWTGLKYMDDRSRGVNHSEGLRPSDSPTRSLAGPRDPHFARVSSLARSFATRLCGLETTCSERSIRRVWLAAAVWAAMFAFVVLAPQLGA